MSARTRGFDFERLLDFFVVGFGKFSGAVFEAQVAQIFVDRVATLHQLVELRAMRRGIGSIRTYVENKINAATASSAHATAMSTLLIGSSLSASRFARASKSARHCGPAAVATVPRFRHRRTTSQTTTSAISGKTIGAIQASD